MTTIRKSYSMLNTAAADTGEWIHLDYRFEPDQTRTVMGDLTTGDTVVIEATQIKAKDKNALAAIIVAADITILESYTADFNDVLNGPWTFVRARKEGTAGNAKVNGIL